jgi:hypothetical protein
MRLEKGWYWAMAALLMAGPPALKSAENLSSAARELARKTTALLGPRASVVVSYRNRSSLPDSDLGRVRREFEAALPPGSGFGAAYEIRLTLSENVSQYLLIEEARKEEEPQTWIAAWNRTAPAAVPPPGITLDRKLIWEQEEPILDLASWDAYLLVLSPTHLTLYQREGAEWAASGQAPLTWPRSWPRDPRGRLRRTESHIEVFLPGAACQGDAGPGLSLDCHPSSEPWVLDSGSRSLLLATYAAERNYFDGRVVLQDGMRKTLPPFYSAAAAEEANGIVWLFALTDGQMQFFNPAAGIEAVGGVSPAWGSDIVAMSGSCGGTQVLATRPVDASQPDALEAFSVSNRAVLPASAPLPFAGPITALWPASSSAALAVSVAGQKYQAYVVTLSCGN